MGNSKKTHTLIKGLIKEIEINEGNKRKGKHPRDHVTLV